MAKKDVKKKRITTTGNRKLVKQELFDKYGCFCWLCGKEKDKNKLTLHHIHQICYTHSTTFKDSMILCCDCHFGVVNKITYDSKEYWDLMNEILNRMGHK
jgi:5-methylcytosine-specific restriction endonuclease McrA